MTKTRFVVVSIFAFGLGCGGAQQPAATGPAGGGAGAGAVKPIPDGFFTLTPALTVADVDAAVAFYVEAFGAHKTFSMNGPDGKPAHAEIKIGDSVVMLGPENAQAGMKSPTSLGGSPGSLTYYVADADAVMNAAVAAGAKVEMPVQDMFWGDRYGQLIDPAGHRWAIATHKLELTPEQIQARGAAMFGGGGGEAAKAPGKPASSPIPEGFHTLTPSVVVADAARQIEFYKAAFGAQEIERMPGPDGRIMHAMVKIGDSILMLSDAFPDMGGPKSPVELGGSAFSLMMYVPDADAAYQRAVGASAKARMPVTDMFWGDRWGSVIDPSGYEWGLATHVEDVPPDQMEARMKAQMEKMGHHMGEAGQH